MIPPTPKHVAKAWWDGFPIRPDFRRIENKSCYGLSKARRGLTLMEVIVAMAIFLLSLAGIVPLVKIGLDRSLEIHLQATALQKCQSKLAGVIAGSEAIAAQTDVPFTDNNPDEDWRWSLDLGQDDIDGVWTVTIRVRLQSDDHKVEVALSQIVLDPTVRGGPPAAPSATGGTTTGGTTTGGG